jgi:hypothetical protein
MGGGGFLGDAWDGMSGFVKKTGKKIEEAGKDTLGSVADDPMGALGSLASMGTSGFLESVNLGKRTMEDQTDQATGQGEKSAQAQEAAAKAARAAAIAALPKDPTVEEIQRQRRARGGRRGNILTSPDQSLGSSGSGKSLLGL